MYPASALFKQYIGQSDREFEIKAVVNGVTYLDTAVVEFEIEDSIVPAEDLTLGSVITSRLTISLRTADTLPTNASIKPYVRLNGVSGLTEWVPLGTFYVDTRSYTDQIWKFVCYDKIILSQQTYVSALTYPEYMAAVFNELCAQIGYDVDSSVAINSAYTIPYKDEDISMREMLGYIASAHGASIRMTKDEKLAFVKFSAGATRTRILASDYFKANETNPLKTYTSIKLTYNTDGETLTSGSGDADHTLSIYNPFMTQAMLDTVFADFNGFSYVPCMMDWRGRPDLEVGDAITVTRRDGSTYPSTILTNKSSFKGGLKSTSTAPSYSTQRSETDYKGSIKQQIAAAARNAEGILPDEPYYGVTIGRANGLKIERSDGVSKAIFNSDLIRILKNSDVVFDVNSDGNLVITGIMHMQAGSTIDWNIVTPPDASQVGAKDINWSPHIVDIEGLAGKLTRIGPDGIYTGTLGAQQVKGLLLEGVTILAGKISGLDNAAVLHIGESGGNINTAYDLTAGEGYRASIRLIPGTMDNAHCGYLQVLENGEVYFYDNVDANQGTPYASIRHDGFYLGAGLAYAPVGTTTIVYKSDGTGFDTDLDGSQDSWTWTKDGNGRITKLVSSGSRVVNVTY